MACYMSRVTSEMHMLPSISDKLTSSTLAKHAVAIAFTRNLSKIKAQAVMAQTQAQVKFPGTQAYPAQACKVRTQNNQDLARQEAAATVSFRVNQVSSLHTELFVVLASQLAGVSFA